MAVPAANRGALRHTRKGIRSGVATGYVTEVIGETPAKALLIDDLLWGELGTQEQAALLRKLLAQGAAAGAKFAVAPLMGYAETDALRGGLSSVSPVDACVSDGVGRHPGAGITILCVSGCFLITHPTPRCHHAGPMSFRICRAGLPQNQRIRWNIGHYDSSGCHDAALSDCDAWHDDGCSADPDIIFDHDRLNLVVRRWDSQPFEQWGLPGAPENRRSTLGRQSCNAVRSRFSCRS